MTQIDRLIEAARRELGYTENPPGSNLTKYGAAYGMDGWPWCVVFLWWCFREAGLSRLFFGGARTASCGTLYSWYQQQGWTVPVAEARRGDIVILNFHGTKDTEHCGIVVDVASPAAGYVNTIEGNTTPGAEGSQDNGGCVALKHRLYRQIVGVIRPQYEEEAEPVKDYQGHWAEEALDWATAIGLIQGYEDGTTRPDAPVTRAELVTILRRYDARVEELVAKIAVLEVRLNAALARISALEDMEGTK